MTLRPIMMSDVDLTIGDTASGPNFKCQLTSVTLTPDTSVQTLKTLCPAGTYNASGNPKWTLELGYANFVDEGTPASTIPALADFLLDNARKTMPCTFRPIAGGKGYSMNVLIVPGAIGGQVDGWAEQSVSLPVEGQPERVAAA